jgi:hypothetical protein
MQLIQSLPTYFFKKKHKMNLLFNNNYIYVYITSEVSDFSFNNKFSGYNWKGD